jgi:hypothetical protein
LRFESGLAKRGQILLAAPIENELVVNQLIDRFSVLLMERNAAFWQNSARCGRYENLVTRRLVTAAVFMAM